jgi:hypothetical protein
MNESQKIREKITNALAGVGFVTLLALGVWFSIQVVKFTPTILSSVASVGTSLSSIFTPAQQTAPQATTTDSIGAQQGVDFSNIKPLTAGEQENGVYPVSGIGISQPNGRIDLSVHILETGIVSTSTNTFVATSPIATSQKGAVRFEVINLGSKESGSWTFNAVLPTYPRHIFHSTTQQSLLPGDKIEFTLGFDQVNGTVSEDVITINVDPTGSIPESSKTNNIVQKTVRIAK